jgi:hypothetical protein
MIRLASCLCLALLACTSTRTPSGYCEDDCRELWTAECFSQCGIERPRDCDDDDDVCRVGGMSGAGAGGGGSGGRDGGSSGRDGGGGSGGNSGAGGVVGGTGGTGGTDGGGTDGDASEPCRDSSECEAEAPLCSAQGECEACVNQSPCEGRGGTPRCDIRTDSATRGECVRCTADDHCDGGEVCFDAKCVECREHLGCVDLQAPQCSEGHACEQCTSDEACAGRASTKRCDIDEESETHGQCVACLDHDDCENPLPQCGSDRTCQGCTGDGACTDRMDTPYCNTLEDASSKGHCVACTETTEAEACDAKACKRDTGTCTTRNRGSVESCGACEADSECDTNRRCVENRIGGVLEGTFCALIQGAGCARAADAERKPYSDPRMLESVDGISGTYCMPVTTCAMLNADLDGSVGKPCDSNLDCGSTAFANDGYCAGEGICTYACSQHFQCPETGLSQCSLVGGLGGYCE